MKEKISPPDRFVVRQESWLESPCSRCGGNPCCRNLPLAPYSLETRSDFVNLTLLSCYDGIYPALKKSWEWTLYLGRDCRFLDGMEGKCTIHGETHQSLVCKSYDAHNCWYVDAFSTDRFKTMIPFDTEMLIRFEQRYGFLSRGFDALPDWEELCDAALEFRETSRFETPDRFEQPASHRLPFKKSRSERHLFFPPYQRPESRSHFELLSFRLGFPGISLAVTDTCWAFLVKTSLNPMKLGRFRGEYFPGIGHKDGDFSFNGLERNHRPYSESGEQWIVLNRSELEILKSLVTFDSSGKVRRLPSSGEILAALGTNRPNKAA